MAFQVLFAKKMRICKYCHVLLVLSIAEINDEKFRIFSS